MYFVGGRRERTAWRVGLVLLGTLGLNSAAERSGQLLIDLNQQRIEVQAALVQAVEDEVTLPQFVDEALFVAALLREHRQLVVRDNQVALPLGVGRVGLGQPLRDAERVPEEPLGLGQIPLRRRQIAELLERHLSVDCGSLLPLCRTQPAATAGCARSLAL